MATVPVFNKAALISLLGNKLWLPRVRYVEGGARNLRFKDKSTDEISDATTEGDNTGIDIDEACALQCLY